jgi:hypothetical protein
MGTRAIAAAARTGSIRALLSPQRIFSATTILRHRRQIMKRAKFQFLGILKKLSRQTVVLNRSYVFLSMFLMATVFGGSAAIARTELGPPGYRGHYFWADRTRSLWRQGQICRRDRNRATVCTRWDSLSSLQSDFRHRSELWSAQTPSRHLYAPRWSAGRDKPRRGRKH